MHNGIISSEPGEESIRSNLRDILHGLGLDLTYQKSIIPNTCKIRLASAYDKKIVEAMDGQIFITKAILDEEKIRPYELSFGVKEIIMSFID